MATMAENLKLSIDKAREQLQRLHTTASKGKKDARHHSLQQKMQQKQTELGSIRERITEAKSAHRLLEQQLSDFQLEERRAKERHRVARETRQQLAKAHDKLRILHSCWTEVSRMVEDAKSVSQELKFASLRYLLTITGNRVEAELRSVPRLRKVSLTVEFPANHYPAHPLSWSVHIVMGDICEAQVKAAILEVAAGSNHFTKVLDAVHNLVNIIKHCC
nr:hypothetical protein BaRGS_026315 [Batillaria attramentaria]